MNRSRLTVIPRGLFTFLIFHSSCALPPGLRVNNEIFLPGGGAVDISPGSDDSPREKSEGVNYRISG